MISEKGLRCCSVLPHFSSSHDKHEGAVLLNAMTNIRVRFSSNSHDKHEGAVLLSAASFF